MLIFAIAIGCLVLAAIPASPLPVSLVHPVLPFPFLLAVLLVRSPRNARGVFGYTLRFRPRENPRFLFVCLFVCCLEYHSSLLSSPPFPFGRSSISRTFVPLPLCCYALGDFPPSQSLTSGYALCGFPPVRKSPPLYSTLKKSPQKRFLFAQSKIILYLCARI